MATETAQSPSRHGSKAITHEGSCSGQTHSSTEAGTAAASTGNQPGQRCQTRCVNF